MYGMMIAQTNGHMTPPTSIHGHNDVHPTDLSPRSSGSSVLSDQSQSPGSSKENLIGSSQHLLQALNGRGPHQPILLSSDDLSPLQRLQFVLERNPVFSNLFNGQEITESILIGSSNHGSDSPSSPIQRDEENPKVNETVTIGSNYIQRSTISPVTSVMEVDEGQSMEGSTTECSNLDPGKIYQCPLCAIVCNGRHSFNEHLVTHTQHHACPKCDYLTNSEDKLRDHLQMKHDVSDPLDALEEDESTVPRINSQGKVKTFRCKKCQHVSVTQSESWTHAATHIPAHKILRCPKCSFVTEFKHHLEYHLRKHVGSKPYKCATCFYICVNQSMLNSHLKSHSPVYQYNCRDCDYQTKYCHSLKMHLRKFNHKPSVVLNPDGTPNPLPIIDIYGTRRGPKMKKPSNGTTTELKMTQKQQKSTVGVHSPANSSSSSSNGSSYSSHGHDSPSSKDGIAIKKTKLNESKVRKLRGFTTSTSPLPPPPPPPPPLKKQLIGSDDISDSDSERMIKSNPPMSPVFSSTKATLQQLLQQKSNHTTKTVMELASKNSLELYAACLNQYIFTNPLLLPPAPPQQLSQLIKEQEKLMTHLHIRQQSVTRSHGDQKLGMDQDELHSLGHAHATPLDLRNPRQDSEKRRRKGKAHRYERQTVEEFYDEPMALDFSNNNNNYNQNGIKVNVMRSTTEEEYNYTIPHALQSSSMTCKYCEISFPDQILYRMHMSYHSGDNDPFLCKSCGKKTKDKVAFFLHLTTDSHS